MAIADDITLSRTPTFYTEFGLLRYQDFTDVRKPYTKYERYISHCIYAYIACAWIAYYFRPVCIGICI